MLEPTKCSGRAEPLETQTEENHRENSAHVSIKALQREAFQYAAEHGLTIRPSRMSRMIRRHVREGRGDIDFRTWFISYADPTGETAVKNVMAGGGANV